MKTRQLLALPLLIGLLLVPLAATADSHEMAPKPITWLSYLQSQPGKSTALSQYIAKDGAKIYDGLMADGQVITWGVGMPINHRPDDDWNILEWVTFRDWAAVDAFMQAFMGMQMAKSPEDMAAEQEEWKSLVVAGSHYDEIVRHRVVVRSEAGTPPGYFNLSYFSVKPGQMGALEKLWVENAQPTMAELQATGAIGGFGMAADEVHDGSGSSALFWTAMPNLAARDAVDAAFEAADEARGEEANKEMMKKFASAVDFTGHHDRIIMVVHNGGGSGGDSGE